MTMVKFLFTILLMAIPFFASALEPIFKLKGYSIILDSSTSTLGVVYNADAITKNDFSKKNLSSYEFAGKKITINYVNVINWDKKSQGLIIKFTYEDENFCFYFPQNIHTSDITELKPFSRFYSGKFMDMYQNQDECHYVEPYRICLTFWLSDDVDFLQSKIGSTFRWKDSEDTYLFVGFDLVKRIFEYRKISPDEIKPSNTLFIGLHPSNTSGKPHTSVRWHPHMYILNDIVWVE